MARNLDREPPRRELMELREKHYTLVMNLATRERQGRLVPLEEYSDFLVENYNRLFGYLRGSKAKIVPSDKIREMIMVAKLMHVVRECREEIELERSRRPLAPSV